MDLCFILTIFACFSSCKTSRNTKLKAEANQWSVTVGGSFRTTDMDSLIANHDRTVFYYILQPSYLSVTHEYIAARIYRKNSDKSYVYTIGLNDNVDDLSYAKEQITKGIVKSFLIYNSVSDLRVAKVKINHFAEDSKYQRKSYLTYRLVATPLLGKPCKNVATNLKQILLETKTKKHSTSERTSR